MTDLQGLAYGYVKLELIITCRPEYYLWNMLGPCYALSLLGLLAFCLPVSSGERVSLQVTVLLAFSIYQIMLAEYIPTDGRIPIMSEY